MPPPAAKKLKFSMNSNCEDKALDYACLVVKDRQFFYSKSHLARYSDYFRDLFFDNNLVKKNKTFILDKVANPDDFETFLETINEVSSLTDENICGVCQLADLFRAKSVQDRCIVFLKKESEKSGKEKLVLYDKYQFLNELKMNLISNIQTEADFKALIPTDVTQLSHATVNMMREKLLEIDVPNPAEGQVNPVNQVQILRGMD